MIKGKPYKRINKLRIYRRIPRFGEPTVYSLWTPDITECIYSTEYYKDLEFIAKNITYYVSGDSICELPNYSNEYLSRFKDKNILNVLHEFNKQHNINEEIYDDNDDTEEYIKIESEFSIDIDKLKDGEIHIKYEREW